MFATGDSPSRKVRERLAFGSGHRGQQPQRIRSVGAMLQTGHVARIVFHIMHTQRPNQRAPGSGGIALVLQIEHPWPAVPEQQR